MQLNLDWLARELRINPLSEVQRQALGEAFRFEFISSGLPIIHQGTSVKNLFLLRSGSLRVVHKNGTRSIMLGTASPNRTFGEISFFGDEPATADVYAENDCAVYIISCEKYHWLMQNHADLAMKLMAYVVRSMGEVIRELNHTRH